MSTTTASARSARRQGRPSAGNEALVPPPYHRQTYKLNNDAKHAIQILAQSDQFRHLDVHMRNLAAALTGIVAEVNDQFTDTKKRIDARTRMRAKEKDLEDVATLVDRSPEAVEADRKHIESLEGRVDAITKQVEEQIRGVVDAEVGSGSMKTILERLGQINDENKKGSRKRRAPRTRRKALEEDEDEDEDMDDDDEYNPDREEPEDTEEVVPAGEIFETQLQQKQAEWQSRTLTQRYSTHNTYIGFYRILHESKHAGSDPPPLPHASKWFEHLESSTTEESQPRTRGARNSGIHRDADADAEEVAIAAERFSIVCPITLLNFKDPVTSTICPHSFERAAIEDMIQRSQLAHGKGRQKVKYVKCPVCSKPLTLSDLKHDPTVLRRVKRKIAEDQERREAGLGADEGDTDEEMQDVDEEVVVRRRSQVSKVKKEEIEERERSMVPGTQFDSIPDADDMTQ